MKKHKVTNIIINIDYKGETNEEKANKLMRQMFPGLYR
jgi:hypothetical protein